MALSTPKVDAQSSPEEVPYNTLPVPAPDSTFDDYTEEEKQELREIEADLARFEQAAEAHHKRTQMILSEEYRTRKNELEARYAERLANAENAENERRLHAISLLEGFIATYPNHKKFTPDAMFRLADLYLDQAKYDFEKSFDLDSADSEDDLLATADYSKAINLWEELLTKFPNYRQEASTLYLLGYYLKQTEVERKALQVFRGLACRNKYDPLAEPEPAPDLAAARAALGGGVMAVESHIYDDCTALTDNQELLDDVWVRGIGDIHFLTPGSLNKAIAAYRKVASNPSSKFYDHAIYKLAWSYYRNDEFLKGIETFDASVVYSDSLVAQGKPPLELRPEAIQYIAISFTDPWSLDEDPDPVRGFDRAVDFYKDRMDEPHVRDVFIQLGRTFTILEAYTQAADSYRIALRNWPLAPDNPSLHQEIVNVFAELGDSDLADEEAGKLALAYAPGTPWFEANETNREAMEAQRRIGEHMLRAAANNTHKAAQAARAEWLQAVAATNGDETPHVALKEKYVELYLKAAALYERFLEENPTSDASYEFTYRLGEVLFYAEHYEEAIPHYVWVRDHREISEERFEKAARSVVKSYEEQLKREIAKGDIVEPGLPTIEELLALPKPIAPKPIPPLYQRLQTALDEYQTLVNDPQTAPAMGYEAALISYRHLDLKDAERRFKTTLDRFCETDRAVKSKDALLAIYEAKGDDAAFKRTNDEFISSKCGSEGDVALAEAQNRSKEFRKAEALYRDKQYGKAADAFYLFYKTAPADDANRPIALYNGALAFEKSGKPKTAVYLFKEFTENPDPLFRDSEYFLPARYLTAVSYYNAFDYDNAVDVYLDVVKIAGDSSRKPPAGDVSAEQMRLNALFNAANLQELARVYKDPRRAPGTGAASLFERYAKLEPDERKSDRALWAVARVWKGAQDLSRQAKAYERWRAKYGGKPGNEDDYVYSFYDMAKSYEKKGNAKAAQAAKKQTLKAWETVGSPQNSAAGDLAAEFAFEDADGFYNRTFTPFKIKRAPRTKKEADTVLGNLDKTAERAQQKFLDLAKYKSGPWALAARTRVGDVRYFQALKIAEIPTPKEIERLDAQYPDKDILIQYEDAIAALVKPLEEAARQQWTAVVDAGREQGVSSRWTQLANERLHDFVSQDEFPVLRNELSEGTTQP